MMKLKVEIDDNLMRQAMRSGKYRSRKAAIEAGLRLLVLRGQTRIRRLRGKIAWDGDLEESRLGRNTDQ
jgi:Arc/MetJ family transcription regulator